MKTWHVESSFPSDELHHMLSRDKPYLTGNKFKKQRLEAMVAYDFFLEHIDFQSKSRLLSCFFLM